MSEPFGRLIVRLGDQELQTVSLGGQVLTIGRNPDNGLPLPNNQVSRYHADVRPDPQGLLVTDLGSANGTFIGEERLLPHQPTVITPGAAFRIGPYELIFEAAAATPAEADDPVSPQPEPAPVALDAPPATLDAPPATLDAPPATLDAPPATLDAPPATLDAPAPTALDAPALLNAPILDASIVSTTNGQTSAQVLRGSAAPEVMRWERLLEGQPSNPPYIFSRDQDSRYLAWLPMIFQENDLLRRYLLIFETIWEPLEYRQDHIEFYIDPLTCPPQFISWLASWFGLTVNQHWPEGRRRLVLSEIFELYRWRGTRHGLARMIELCTGLSAEIDDRETPFVFRIRLTIPPGHPFDRDLVIQLVEAHKPAHAGYILELIE